jgi:hypothetical protein
MPRRPPDLLEVVVLSGHAEHALVVDGAGVAALLDAGQDVLELHHAAVREEQRLVPDRHERRTGHDLVAAFCEVVDEAAADVGGGQADDPRIRWNGGGPHRPQW